MIDIHSHILPGIDDGAPNLERALEMAKLYVDQGVRHVVCTPHILPGVYHNTGPSIRNHVDELQQRIGEAGIPLSLFDGADNHVVGDFVDGLKSGRLLTLARSRYVLVEPPHHVAPQRLDQLFFSLMTAGYHPILTHPERLTWIEAKYDLICQLAHRGVWMQITSGSLTGSFGRRVRYWADKMLSEGLVHVIASDAHNTTTRRPDLDQGRRAAAALVGAEEAQHMVVTRPSGVLSLRTPSDLPKPIRADWGVARDGVDYGPDEAGAVVGSGGMLERLRRIWP